MPDMLAGGWGCWDRGARTGHYGAGEGRELGSRRCARKLACGPLTQRCHREGPQLPASPSPRA